MMQRLANMQYQLQEAKEHGELEQFISDQHDDLKWLLDQAIRKMGRDEFE